MKYYEIDKTYFITKSMTLSRLEIMEQLESIFWLKKIEFIWNMSEKNEYNFYWLVYDYLFNKSKTDQIIKFRFNNILKDFNY